MDKPTMKRLCLVTLLASLALLPASFAQLLSAQSTTMPTDEELPEVLVMAAPGPALWKVSSGDHSLWLLPVVAPLPRDLRWRPNGLDELIGQSEEVFTEASLSLRLEADRASAPEILAALRIPGKTKLNEALPPAVYRQFIAYNRRFGGNDLQLEQFRPSFAAMELRKRALARMELDTDGRVHDTVAYFAGKRLIPLQSLAREIAPRPRSIATSLTHISPQADAECAQAQLGQLETDLREAVARSNAWSVGDVAALRRDWEARQKREELVSCRELFSALAPTDRAIKETRDRGYRALKAALRKNRSTVALVLADEVFDPEGIVARLWQDGYLVEAP